MSEEQRLREQLDRKGYTSYLVMPVQSGEGGERQYLVNVEDEDGTNRKSLGTFAALSRQIAALPDAR